MNKIICKCCNIVINKKYSGYTGSFCNYECRSKFFLQIYTHLFSEFEKNINEASYLFGLLMGDGHFKKTGKYTTRISIAFNKADLESIRIAMCVLTKLKINYFIEPKIHQNCKTFGFILPDELLNKYNLLFSGKKFINQPRVSTNISSNINFALGLLNSDGCMTNTPRHKYISFCNTVESIVEDIKLCLTENKIDFKEYFHTYKTKPTWKKRITIMVMRRKSFDTIIKYNYSKWRELFIK